MKGSFSIWIVGALAATNAMLAISLYFTWLSIFEMYSYPIDFFFPITRTETRAIVSLYVAAVTVPMGFLSFRHAATAMPAITRAISLFANSGAAIVAIAFVIWKYAR
jgi:hypothetical protein